MADMALPWQPLYTVERSGRPEITVYGIAYGWAEERKLLANMGRNLVRVGDTEFPLWTRSLLKPWQLMVLYPTLKASYPNLSPRHLALMAASHQGDPNQMMLLDEIMGISGVQEGDLHCPPCEAMHPENARHLGTRSPRLHPCSGKHLAHLLFMKAQGQPLEQYLNPQAEPYRLLRELLGYMLGREPEDFPMTLDGCGMPNVALAVAEIAQLYHALATPLPKDIVRQSPDAITDALFHWNEVGELLRAHADVVGGAGRLDTRLMQALPAIAKEGANGLLALGLGQCDAFPDGAGYCIKLAGGYDPNRLEIVIKALLSRYGIAFPGDNASPDNDLLAPVFHFDTQPASIGP